MAMTEKEWRQMERSIAKNDAIPRMYRRMEKAWKKEREQARNRKQFDHAIAWI